MCVHTGGWPPLNCSLFSNNVLINGYFVSSFLLLFYFFFFYMFICIYARVSFVRTPLLLRSAAIVASYARHCHRPESRTRWVCTYLMYVYNIQHDRRTAEENAAKHLPFSIRVYTGRILYIGKPVARIIYT